MRDFYFAYPKVSQVVRQEESAKLSAQRELIVNQATKSNRILVRTKNVCPHVMQDHHHWEKAINLTGNTEENFRMVFKVN